MSSTNDDKTFSKEQYIAADEAAFVKFNSGKISASQYAELLAVIDEAYYPSSRSALGENALHYVELTEYSSANVDNFRAKYDYYRIADEAGFAEYNALISQGCSHEYSQKVASAVRHEKLRWAAIYRLMPNKLVFF